MASAHSSRPFPNRRSAAHTRGRSGGILAQLENVRFIGNLLTGLREYDYEPLGRLRFINWAGEVVEDSKSLQVLRVAHLAGIVLTEKWNDFVTDHQIICKAGAGYMSTVCPA